MASFNKVILMGRLTADPELKQTQSGASVTSFNIAVDRKYAKGEEKQADFIAIVAWRQTAEFICKYARKGSKIAVTGKLTSRKWQDANGNNRVSYEVVCDTAELLNSKQEGNSETANTSQSQKPVQSEFGASGGYMPDAYKPAKSASVEFEPVADDNLPF